MNPYRLTRTSQRLLAATILLALLSLFISMAGLPAAGLIGKRQAALKQAEAELGRWQGIAASRNLVEAAADDPALGNRIAALALQSPSSTQAASAIQAHVRRILMNAEADLKSIQPLETRSTFGLQETGVRVVALTSHRQLQDAIFALENSNPRMFVREANIQVSTGRRGTAGEDEDTILQVRLDIFAYLVPVE